MDRKLFCDQLVAIETVYPGVMSALGETGVPLLVALGKAHSAFVAYALTPEEQAQIEELKKSKANLQALGIDGKAISGIDAEIKGIVGDPESRAWKAYRAALKPVNGDKGKASKIPYTNVVVKCPFKEHGVLFVVVTDKTEYQICKPDGDKVIPQPLPDFLAGFPITSLTAVRKLAWAFVNNKVPAICTEGIGKSDDPNVEGGTAAQIISHDPVTWLNKRTKRARK